MHLNSLLKFAVCFGCIFLLPALIVTRAEEFNFYNTHRVTQFDFPTRPPPKLINVPNGSLVLAWFDYPNLLTSRSYDDGLSWWLRYRQVTFR